MTFCKICSEYYFFFKFDCINKHSSYAWKGFVEVLYLFFEIVSFHKEIRNKTFFAKIYIESLSATEWFESVWYAEFPADRQLKKKKKKKEQER